MFYPNQICTVIPRLGSDLYGEFQYGDPVPYRCAVVHMRENRTQSSTHMNTGGSIGNTLEQTNMSDLLLEKTAEVSLGDRLQLDGLDFIVERVEPRYNVHGRLDHLQVKCSTWALK